MCLIKTSDEIKKPWRRTNISFVGKDDLEHNAESMAQAMEMLYWNSSLLMSSKTESHCYRFIL